MIHYFAYGSNLHPVRLQARVSSAELIGGVELKRHRLAFHKKSHDDSGKCNILETGVDSQSVFGAIYKIHSAHKVALDRFEGKGKGYIDSDIHLCHKGREYHCFTYRAQDSYIMPDLNPYHWYKELVLLGAQYHQFPGHYIESIAGVMSMQDPDVSRRQEYDSLIKRMIAK